MKACRILLLLCFCALCHSLRAQDSLVVWRAQQPLQWDDFTGTQDPAYNFEAGTHTKITYTYRWTKHDGVYKITFKAHGYMVKARSWKTVGKETPALLAHEQGHFDIAELYARKLLAALNAQTYDDNYKTTIKRIFDEWMLADLNAQKQYDEETDHSKNKIQQALWISMLNHQLEELPVSEY